MDPGNSGSQLPTFPWEEGQNINITLGFDMRPVCIGHHNNCLKPLHQGWLIASPKGSNFSKMQLHLLSTIGFAYNTYNITKEDIEIPPHHT